MLSRIDRFSSSPSRRKRDRRPIDGPGDIRGSGPGRKDLALRDDDFRDRLQRRLRGQDEALAKEDEGDHVQEEEGRKDRLRQERQTGTRARDVRLQEPSP